ncbi:unnamed protein product [Paramecium pentaurelia]|uniref:Uncharacterized protein n=1 Tax=Paramecium pentaurelia TaxID=43138 RepID=A0A8S1WIT3_9CILI|nr:unnamed protein product [Paramecium pentaurelia]
MYQRRVFKPIKIMVKPKKLDNNFFNEILYFQRILSLFLLQFQSIQKSIQQQCFYLPDLKTTVNKHSKMILSINSNRMFCHILNLLLYSNIKVKHMTEVHIILAKSLINIQQKQEILYCIWFWIVLLTQN